MKKSILKISSSILMIAFTLWLVWIGLKNFEKSAYEKGAASVVTSCGLEDICTAGYSQKGFGANYEHGFKYQIFECGVITGRARIEDDFEFEGDWDRCDDSGENCQPFVRDGQVLEN
jgi:hypothetical protein